MYEVNVETLLEVDPAKLKLSSRSICLYARLLAIDQSVSEIKVASIDGKAELWLAVAAWATVCGTSNDFVYILGEWGDYQQVQVHQTKVVAASETALWDEQLMKMKRKRIKLTMRMAALA